MEITVLGSGTGEPSRERGFPGILLRYAKRTVLVDSGSGTLRSLLAEGVTYQDIDEIWYTHLHCDHVSELAPILFAMRNMTSPRERDLTIVGPRGIGAYYEGLLGLYAGTLDPEGYRLIVEELEEGARRWAGGRLVTLGMDHTPSSIAYRLEAEGRVIALSGDTAPCANLVSLGSGADLLVIECSFPDGMAVEGHLTPHLAGEAAERAGCRRLLLTHLYPVCDRFDISSSCQAVFGGEVIVARDGLKVKV